MHCHWHQDQSNTVVIHGPRESKGEICSPGGVGISCHTIHKCLQQDKHTRMILDLEHCMKVFSRNKKQTRFIVKPRKGVGDISCYFGLWGSDVNLT